MIEPNIAYFAIALILNGLIASAAIVFKKPVELACVIVVYKALGSTNAEKALKIIYKEKRDKRQGI